MKLCRYCSNQDCHIQPLMHYEVYTCDEFQQYNANRCDIISVSSYAVVGYIARGTQIHKKANKDIYKILDYGK